MKTTDKEFNPTERIKKLKSITPRLKANKKISPMKIEALEFELKYLEIQQQSEDRLEALELMYDECAVLKKQIPIKQQNMNNSKHKAAYDRYMDRMILAKKVINGQESRNKKLEEQNKMLLEALKKFKSYVFDIGQGRGSFNFITTFDELSQAIKSVSHD